MITTFFVLTVLLRIPSIIMFTTHWQTAFYAKIADPAMGGSYMTLLTTISNLGFMWSAQVGLRAISAIDDGCEGPTPGQVCQCHGAFDFGCFCLRVWGVGGWGVYC